VSGRVTYTDYDISKEGIAYHNPIEKPIRGAVVELHQPLGTIVASANTSETGGYSFSAPANSTVNIVVKAALGAPNAPDTKVVDNTNGDAMYTMRMAVTTVTSAVTTDFNAESGWDVGTTSYTARRVSAPFAILDTIHQGRLFVQNADPAAVFPALSVQWSDKNKTAQGEMNKAIGDGPGTSFGAPYMWLNGAAGIDTDEYDSAVIAHEWGHYFQEEFSSTDSQGGDHTFNDISNLSLTFDEGFATAMGSMIMRDKTQINTMGPNQEEGSVLVADIESDSRSDTDLYNSKTSNITYSGPWSEASMIEVIWDLFDSAENGNVDDDELALGFAPLYKVMIGGHKNTQSFTSIYSFIHHLKRLLPLKSAAIDAILEAENVSMTGADEYANPTYFKTYTTIIVGAPATEVDASGIPLRTDNGFGNASSDNNGGNKLLNYRLFKSTFDTPGCYALSATTPGSTAELYVRIKGDGESDLYKYKPPQLLHFGIDDVGTVLAFSYGADSNNVSFTVGIDIAADAADCD
jgi:hypothetical protein